MQKKADLYAELMKEYYRLEESILAEASAGLAASGSPEAGRAVLELAVSQLRAFVVKALQSQALRLTEIEEALSMTGDSLAKAQQRMEGMEQENAEAAAVLFKMKVRSESQPQAAQAQELADRVIEQEKLLQKRESELAALRKQILEAQADSADLLRRLEEEERRAAEPEAAAPAPPDAQSEGLGRRLQAAEAALETAKEENDRQALRLKKVETARDEMAQRIEAAEVRARQKETERAALEQRLAKVEPEAVAELTHLGSLLAEAQALAKQREAEQAALAGRLSETEAEAAALRARAAAPKEAARPADEVPTLRARLAELERRLAEPGAEVEALRQKLKDEETFRGGFIQRIQALEAARHREQKEAKLAAQKIAAAEKAPWTQERAELQGRLAALEKERNRLRAVNENTQREWTDTLARQDALRLAEIAELKRELERLRSDRRPG